MRLSFPHATIGVDELSVCGWFFFILLIIHTQFMCVNNKKITLVFFYFMAHNDNYKTKRVAKKTQIKTTKCSAGKIAAL